MTTATYNDVRAYLLLGLAGIMATLGLWLLVRGGRERPLWRPMPGRIVLGAFLILYAATEVDRAQVRIRGTGTLADFWSVCGVIAALAAGVWSIVRFWRGDLEARRQDWDGMTDRRGDAPGRRATDQERAW